MDPVIPTGEVIADVYRVNRRLGSGAFGDVYLVTHRGTGAQLALKMLLSLPNDRLKQRFLARARLMSELDHDHIVRVTDVGAHRYRVYYVMEYAPQGALRDAIKEYGAFEVARGLDVCAQALQALEHAHAHGVFHRDLRPGNLLLFDEGLVKLADFGVARESEEEITAAGDFLATLGFVAPEQREDPAAASPEADLFSLGALLYTMVSARLRPPPALHRLQIQGLSSLMPHAVAEVVVKATQLDPKQRYRSAADMAEAIEAAREDL